MVFPVFALLDLPLLELSWFNVGLSQLGLGFSVLMLLVARQINAYSTDALHLRTGDCLGRLGGEEFALLMPEATLAEASETAERLRQAAAVLQLNLQGHAVRQTVGIGIALLQKEDTSLSSLMHRADLAMYAAKTQGRNRVVCEQPSPPAESQNLSANTTIQPA